METLGLQHSRYKENISKIMAKLFSAGRTKVILAFLLLFGPAFLLIFIASRGCEHKFKELDDFGAAVNYAFKKADGEVLKANDMKGNIVLVTTLQSSCPEECAVSFWHLNQKIYQHLRTNNKKLGTVKILSLVTDGKGNAVEDLTPVVDMLYDEVEDYNPDIWIVATGDARAMYDFEKNGRSLLQKGDEFFGGESFQELILLMDRENHLRMVLSGTSEGMIRRMFEHVALLKKSYDLKEYDKAH